MSYSIYYMERPVTEVWFGEPVVRSYHAFLALVKEEVGKEPVIEEEIHFKNEGFLKLKIHQYPHDDFGAGDHFPELCPYGHVGGHEDHMRSIWNQVIETAKLIETGKLPFGTQRLRDSFNCRSATIALLCSIGLEYYAPEGVESDSGVEADILSKIGIDLNRDTMPCGTFKLKKAA